MVPTSLCKKQLFYESIPLLGLTFEQRTIRKNSHFIHCTFCLLSLSVRVYKPMLQECTSHGDTLPHAEQNLSI